MIDLNIEYVNYSYNDFHDSEDFIHFNKNYIFFSRLKKKKSLTRGYKCNAWG